MEITRTPGGYETTERERGSDRCAVLSKRGAGLCDVERATAEQPHQIVTNPERQPAD
jgi:hypothetical protein